MKRTKSLTKKGNKNLKNTNKKLNPQYPDNPTNNYTNGNGIDTPLTVKQDAFVREYLIDLNATQAAIRAGYSEGSAAVMGSQNLRKHNIQAAITFEMEKRSQRTQVSPDKVVRELAKLAFSNMKSFMEWNEKEVKIIDSNSLSDDDSACVSEIIQTDTSSGRTIKIKLYDKKAALELLGRHLGMFSDTIRNVVIGDVNSPVSHKLELTDKTIKAAFDKLYGKEE
jgi:phage terminase small subunit